MPEAARGSTARYQPLRQAEDEAHRPRLRASELRTLVGLALMGVVAAFYMLVGFRTASSTLYQRGTIFTPARDELLRSENERLKDQLEALNRQLLQRSAAVEQAGQRAAPSASSMGTSSSLLAATAATVAPMSVVSGAAQPPAQQGAGPDARCSAAELAATRGCIGQYRLTTQLVRSRCNAHNIILVTFVNSKRTVCARRCPVTVLR